LERKHGEVYRFSYSSKIRYRVVHKAWNIEEEMVNTKNVLVEENQPLKKLFVALILNSTCITYLML
jgi:hypothetical protein